MERARASQSDQSHTISVNHSDRYFHNPWALKRKSSHLLQSTTWWSPSVKHWAQCLKIKDAWPCVCVKGKQTRHRWYTVQSSYVFWRLVSFWKTHSTCVSFVLQCSWHFSAVSQSLPLPLSPSLSHYVSFAAQKPKWCKETSLLPLCCSEQHLLPWFIQFVSSNNSY